MGAEPCLASLSLIVLTSEWMVQGDLEVSEDRAGVVHGQSCPPALWPWLWILLPAPKKEGSSKTDMLRVNFPVNFLFSMKVHRCPVITQEWSGEGMSWAPPGFLLSPQHESISWVCACCYFSHVWLFDTLQTVAHQPPLSMGFSRQIVEWVAMPSSGGSSWPRY